MKKKVIAIGIGVAVLSGASVVGYAKHKESNINKELYAGIESLNSEDYEKSKNDMENVLKLDSNNKEAKIIIDIINCYENSKKYFDEGNLNGAEEEINKIPSDYSKYNIQDKVDKLKEEIKTKKDNINKINEQLNSISSLINKKEFKKASEEIGKVEIKNGTKEQEEKLEGYKNTANEGIKKIELEEKKKREEEAKKKEEERKAAEKKTQESNSNKVTTQNKTNVNSNNSSIYYENKELGLSMTFPASWRGRYYIISDGKEGMTVMMKLKQTSEEEAGILFCIESEDMYRILDGVRTIQSKNGIKYYAGRQTGMTVSEYNPQLQEYRAMSREAYNVLTTIKPIN
jgi:hypothetical protein